MAQTVTLPTHHLERIESRLATVERAVKRLLDVFETKSSGEVDRLSDKAEQRYLQDLVDFLAQEKVTPQPGFTSAKELVDYLDRV